MTALSYLPDVKDQYEDFPYPPRDPEQELRMVIRPTLDDFNLMRFYCYGGRKDFSKSFRVLVAGGGTGDITMYMGEALKSTNAQIVHLDISTNSTAIAKKRAEKRGLTNIIWVQRSLLDLPNMPELGQFDYINCGGVLHHLADPDAGLKALSSVLKDDGAMGLMVYGKYGRTGIYGLQESMRILAASVPDRAQKVEICKSLLKTLPKGNWYNHLKHHFDPGIQLLGDAEIFDLFMHTQDRPYSVPELYDWTRRCNLHLLNFIYYDGLARVIYEPRSFLADPELSRLAGSLPEPERQALAELLYGEIFMHFFFVAKQPVKLPQPVDESAIPLYTTIAGFPDLKQALLQQIAASNGPVIPLSNASKSGLVRLQRGKYTVDFIEQINGKKNVGELITIVCEKYQNNADETLKASVAAEWKYLYDVLHTLDWMLLRY